MRRESFVSTAEAAFLADLTLREMNRVVDEHLVPDSLAIRAEGGRKFAKLAAVFARFYFATDKLFLARQRTEIVQELTRRFEQRTDVETVVALKSTPEDLDLSVFRSGVRIDLFEAFRDVVERVARVEQAKRLIETDPHVLGGLPVIRGTRIPVSAIADSVDKGITTERILEAYPSLNEESIDAACIYARISPQRGPRRRIDESRSGWVLRTRKVVGEHAK